MSAPMTPVEIAWRLASAHGHEWAVEWTPAVRAFSRACAALDAARAAWDGWDERDAIERAKRAREDAWTAYRADEESPTPPRGRPPRTEAEARECEAVGAEWTAQGRCIAGIGFRYAHITGTGRLRWRVDPTRPQVLIEVWRPQGLAVAADVAWRRNRVAIAVEATPIALVRHVDVMDLALGVLGLPPCPDDVLRDPIDGLTPALRDLRMGLR